MLILQQFDIQLIRLEKEDIELVRHWRNAAHVSNQMIYRNFITQEMQEKWFDTINNPYNYYFIIVFEGKKVGLINAKNYDPKSGFGEGGIFIGENDYELSFAAVFASLTLLNFVFYMLPNIRISRIRILKDNLRAIHYNKLLGYEIIGESNEGIDYILELTKERYMQKGMKMNKAATLFSEGSAEMLLKGEPSPNFLAEINELLLNNPSPMAIPGLQMP
jgi:UDP-4-amino-4,6-dideoxy-N-acetyl-beta-L-altrosamine N-acetyltransferase